MNGTRMYRNKKRKTRKVVKRRQQRGGKIPIEEYTTTLGSGGYGMIVEEPTGQRVVKIYHNPKACNEMNKEFKMSQKVHSAFEVYPLPQVLVPKYLQIDNTPFRYEGKDMLCGIEMTRLHPVEIMKEKAINPITHIILSREDNESDINIEMGRRADEPVWEENPSRGFFAGPNYIETVILPSLTPEQKGTLGSIQDIAKTIGKAFGIIVGGAGVVPTDVEYCLVMNNGKLHIAILDFGMAYDFPPDLDKREISKQIREGGRRGAGVQDDIYFPARRHSLFKHFEEGMMEALTYIEEINTHKKNILADVIERYEM